MGGFITGAVVIVVGLFILAIIGIVCEEMRVSRIRRGGRTDTQRILRESRQHERTFREYRKLVRVATIRALTIGSKCRGCGETVPRDELEPCGEDAKGRPIDLCAPCRKLMGVESEDEQESKDASKDNDDQGIDIVE